MGQFLKKVARSVGLGKYQDRTLLEVAHAAYRSRDFEKAHRLLLPLAEQGERPYRDVAQIILGGLYFAGQGVEKDDVTAARWMRLAATSSNVPFVQRSVGNNFRLGQGEPKDLREAIKGLRKAAVNGHAPSQLDLGKLFEDGIDGIPDYEKAAYWYRQVIAQPTYTPDGPNAKKTDSMIEAIEADHHPSNEEFADAKMRLGLLLLDGRGVPKDYVEAARHLRDAADLGRLSAMTLLGSMYEDGLGVSQDFARAASWYTIAAENGFVLAQDRLAILLSSGKVQYVPSSGP